MRYDDYGEEVMDDEDVNIGEVSEKTEADDEDL